MNWIIEACRIMHFSMAFVSSYQIAFETKAAMEIPTPPSNLV